MGGKPLASRPGSCGWVPGGAHPGVCGQPSVAVCAKGDEEGEGENVEHVREGEKEGEKEKEREEGDREWTRGARD